MINNVLKDALGVTVGSNTNYVPSVEAALQSGAGTQVSMKEAQPGDIVISPNAGHIGIVDNNGRVLSNSSSRASMVWSSPLSGDGFQGYCGSGQARVYRLDPEWIEDQNPQSVMITSK